MGFTDYSLTGPSTNLYSELTGVLDSKGGEENNIQCTSKSIFGNLLRESSIYLE